MANTFKFGNGNWAVKDGYALAYNDENNNFKPLPFDFTRASSATRVNKQGLIETVPSDKPRIDFLDNTSGHLLLEPSRTNVFTHSENISNSFWTKDGISITSDSIVSPNGLQTADKLVENSSNSNHRFYNNNFGITSGSASLSCFAKAGERNELRFDEGVGGNGIKVNLTDGSFTLLSSATGGVDFIGNGWYHIYFSYTVSSFLQTRVSILKDDTASYQGDGSSGLYVWGLQQEVGSYATSYIPTEGSSVTRVAETNSQTVPDGIIGQTEGTVFAEINISDNIINTSNDDLRVLELRNSGNIVNIQLTDTDTFRFVRLSPTESATTIITDTALTLGGNFKLAASYKSGDSAFYINGNQIGTSTDTFTFAELSNIYIGQSDAGSLQLSNPIKEVKLYNTRLSNTELQNLTS